MRSEHYNSPVTVTSSAPTRIDLAGGTIDIWPLYLFHAGAQTLNAAISLRAHARVEPRDDGRVGLRLGGHGARGRVLDDAASLPGDGDAAAARAAGARVRRHGPHAHHARRVAGRRRHRRVLGPERRRLRRPRPLAPACGSTGEALLAAGDERRGAGDQGADRRAGLPAGALRRHRRRRARGRRRRAASPLDVDPRELERRIVLCYTGRPAIRAPTTGRSPSGTSTATAHVFDCFERIRDTAVDDARGARGAATGTASAGIWPTEWDNRKRLAPGVTTPAIDALIAARRRPARPPRRCAAPAAAAASFCLGAAGRAPAAVARGAGGGRRAPAATSGSRPTACGSS